MRNAIPPSQQSEIKSSTVERRSSMLAGTWNNGEVDRKHETIGATTTEKLDGTSDGKRSGIVKSQALKAVHIAHCELSH